MAVSLALTGRLDTATRHAARLLVDGAFAGDLALDGALTCDWRPGDRW